MKIWIDADACPNTIKEILFRAASKRGVEVILVANQPLAKPASKYVRTIQVSAGFDEADDRIVAEAAPEDLVITADIPLAAQIIEKGASALNPRGELYTAENVRDRLATRDLMAELRDSGAAGGGPAALGPRERQAFANHLDRLLTHADTGRHEGG